MSWLVAAVPWLAADATATDVAAPPLRFRVIELALHGDSLEAALMEAEQLYADARAVTNGVPTCQQCIHWRFIEGDCSLGFPEGRRSGGRHAKECAAYWLS